MVTFECGPAMDRFLQDRMERAVRDIQRGWKRSWNNRHSRHMPLNGTEMVTDVMNTVGYGYDLVREVAVGFYQHPSGQEYAPWTPPTDYSQEAL